MLGPNPTERVNSELFIATTAADNSSWSNPALLLIQKIGKNELLAQLFIERERERETNNNKR